MEDLIEGFKNGAIVGIGIGVFLFLFEIWLLPANIATKKGLDQSTKTAVWAFLVLSIFFPPFWIIAALIVRYSKGVNNG